MASENNDLSSSDKEIEREETTTNRTIIEEIDPSTSFNTARNSRGIRRVNSESSETDFETIRSIIDRANTFQQEARTLATDTASPNSNSSDQKNITFGNADTGQLDASFFIEGEPRSGVPITSVAARTRNNVPQNQQERHIMISYNRASAGAIARRIYNRLLERGYHVWFDDTDLHDNVYTAMGAGLDNCYLLLPLINVEYSRSQFAMSEIEYAHQKKIRIVPCRVTDGFCPIGGLGVIISSLLYIEFGRDDQFDESFERLVREIEFSRGTLGMTRASTSSPTTTADANTNFRDQFMRIITAHTAEIGQNPSLRREIMTDDVFYRTLRELIRAFCPEMLATFQENVSSGQTNEARIDHVLHRLIEQDDQLIQHIRALEENYDRNREYLLELDHRLAASQRFQQAQETANSSITQQHSRQGELLRTFVRVQADQHQDIVSLRHQIDDQNEQLANLHRRQQEQEMVSRRLQEQVQQLTELTVTQQRHYAENVEALNQTRDQLPRLTTDQNTASINRQERRQRNSLILNILNKSIQTVVLLSILIVLLRPE